MITLSPEQAALILALLVAIGYAVIRWRDARNNVVIADARRIILEAETEKLESDTSSKAVEAVTEGFRKKDVEVSALHQRNTVLERENAVLEADRDYWKRIAEGRWNLVEEKNTLLKQKDKQLMDCASVNETANTELARVKHELDVVSKLYAAEIASTIDKHLLDGNGSETMNKEVPP